MLLIRMGKKCLYFQSYGKPPPEDLVELEGFILEELFDTGVLYNLHKSSDGGMKGMVVSEDTKAKAAESRKNSEACKKHIAWLSSPENIKIATALASTPEVRAKAVATRRANGHTPFEKSRIKQIEAARQNLFAALDWAVANGKTRDEALTTFGSSWGSLKKFLPEWEDINGPLLLPKRASGEKSGAYKHGLSAEKRRKKTPEELEESRKMHSERMSGENNPMFGKTHTEEARKLISEAVRNHARQH